MTSPVPMIQPIGFLLGVDSDWRVTRSSSTLAHFLGDEADDAIGKPALDLIAGEAIHALRNRLALLRGANAIERIFRCALRDGGPPFDLAIHLSGHDIIIEGQPSTERGYGDATGTVRAMIGRLDECGDDASFLAEVARQYRALTGFDRVTVAPLDPDGAAIIAAESAKSGIASRIGERDPELFDEARRQALCATPVSVIADAAADPIAVDPAHPFDLSRAVLRAPGATEAGALRSDGFASQITIAIVAHGQLWGVVRCHHQTPRSPGYERRSIIELFAQMIGMRIESRGRAPSAVQHEAAERQDVLIAELNHRVRNILSLIRGLVRQSRPPEGTSIEQFVRTIDQRVHALARAHNQITNDEWGPAPLRTLLEAEVAGIAGHRERIRLTGDAVLMKPQAYSVVALLVHELVTNSVKHGSLAGAGTVAVDWRHGADGSLTIDWTERGGSPAAAPTRHGFGTTIIRNSVPYDLGGTADLAFEPAGFRAAFTIPARHIVSDGDEATSTPIVHDRHVPGQHDPMLLAGRSALLVEDSLIIALDAEDVLRRLGARGVSSEPSVVLALAAIERDRPDLAILDINLGDGDSFPIADRLDALGVPFLFATGYGDQAMLPPRHANRIVLQKPYSLASMSQRLPDILPV